MSVIASIAYLLCWVHQGLVIKYCMDGVIHNTKVTWCGLVTLHVHVQLHSTSTHLWHIAQQEKSNQ